MRKLFVITFAVAAVLLWTTLPSSADSDLPDIRPHRHFILQPDGTKVEVGPRVCDNPLLQQAFNQFHANVHHPVEGGQGPAAPGLHNHRGAEITVTGCEAP
jgi:hypothetical protein